MIGGFQLALIAVIILEYALIGVSLLRGRTKISDDTTLEQAFAILEASLKRSYPELPAGFTWREALSKIQSSSTRTRDLDWDEIRDTFNRYEAFRYGGMNYENPDLRSVIRLLRRLEREQRFVI